MTKSYKFIVLITYLFMITLNALANSIPIGGEGTGAISDSYPNLFAPAGYTFAIWAVIYLLLATWVIFLICQPELGYDEQKSSSFKTISLLFSISSVANGLWILTWHYRMIGLSVILMLTILICLIKIMAIIKNTPLDSNETLKIKPPIGVYLGWITVATIANITAYLVSLQWNGFGLSEEFWLVSVLFIGVIIALATMRWSSCGAFGLVVIWAYIGILVKHLNPTNFNGAYPTAIWTLIGSIAFLTIGTFFTMKKTIKKLKN